MLRNSAFVTLLSVGGSILGFAVQVLLAQYFGLGVQVEAYFFSLSIPVFVAGMASTMMSYAVVPRLVNCEKNTRYHHKYIGSLLIGVTILAFILMGILITALSRWQINSLPLESPIRHYEHLQVLIFLAYLIGAFQIVQACLTTILNSVRFYILASAISLLTNVGTLISLWTFEPVIDVLSAPVGMLLGTVVSVIVQIYILRLQLFPLPSLNNLLWTELRQLICSAPFTVVAMSCFSSYTMIDAYWAPQAGSGTLAALSYAQRLIIGVGNLAVAGPIVVMVPDMAELVRDNKYEHFRDVLIRILITVGGIGSGLALVLMIFANKIIEHLFARGEFGQQEMINLATTLRHMAPGMVTMLMSAIGLRALFCFPGAERIASVLGMLWTILYFLTSGLMHEQGAAGIAIGYSLSWTLLFLLLIIVIFNSRKKTFVDTRK